MCVWGGGVGVEGGGGDSARKPSVWPCVFFLSVCPSVWRQHCFKIVPLKPSFYSAVEIRGIGPVGHGQSDIFYERPTKMLECRTKCPTENDEKKRNSIDHKGQQLGFMSSRCFCRHSGCQRFRPFSDLTPRGFGRFPFQPWRFRPSDIKMSDFCQSLFWYSFYPCNPIISDRSPGLPR